MNSRQILNHPLIARRYFFPRRDGVPNPFWIDCRGVRLACVYHAVSPEALTLVHFHGNGEVVADYLDILPALLGNLGCNCLLAEYRGYGASGGEPQLGEMLEDAPEIIRALGIAPEKIVLFGRSVGSLFAVKAAGRFPQAAGLILESAIADPLERLLLRLAPEEIGTTRHQLAAALQESLDVPAVLQAFDRPALILHTRHDELIDPSHAARLADWCAGPVQMQVFSAGGHNDIMFVNTRQYFALIREFLKSLE